MALQIDFRLKLIITELMELTRTYRHNVPNFTDQCAAFCLLLALSSEGLALGAVDANGKPIWAASSALILAHDKIKRFSSGDAAVRPIGGPILGHRS